MKEKEFEALLAIEGKQLFIYQKRFRVPRKSSLEPFKTKLFTSATVFNAAGKRIVGSDFHPRRDYAIKVLVKKYYADN